MCQEMIRQRMIIINVSSEALLRNNFESVRGLPVKS